MSTNITSLPLGTLLTILFSQGIRMQMNTDYSDWDFIKQVRDGDPQGRETRFTLQTTLSPASVRYRGVGNRSFPKPQQPDTAEYIAQYTELTAAVGMEQNLYERAIIAKDKKYADPFAQVIKSNAVSQKKRLSADIYLDGSGAIFESGAAADDTNIAAGSIVVSVSQLANAKGHVGTVELNDKFVCAQQDGTARNPSGGTGTGFAYYQATNVDRVNDQVTLTLRNSSDATAINYAASNIVATDVFYLNDSFDGALPDLTDTSLDYGKILHMPGLPSLAASDGRVCHGLTMSGVLAGSDYSANNDAIGLRHLQRALTQVKTNVGEKDFKWEKFIAAPETFDAFIEINEADKRIRTEEDKVRGGSKFVYQHRTDTVELMTSIYCPKTKIWMPPTPVNKSERILESKMTDFKPVKAVNGDPFHLAVDSNGNYQRDVVGYMDAYGTMICKHPRAIASISSFTLGDE